MKRRRCDGLMAVVLLLGTPMATAHSTFTDRVWDGSAGDQLWSTPDNWDPNDTNDPAFVPDIGGGSGEHAIIGDSTGDRNIITPGGLTTISFFEWTQSPAAVGVNQITLGGDLTINHAVTGSWTQSNATGDPSRMVFDLNGHKLSIPLHIVLNDMTLVDSGGGGVFEGFLLQGGANATVGPGVTLRQRSSGQFKPGLVTYDPTSTAIIAGGTSNNIAGNGSALGNLQIGEQGGATVHASMANAYSQTMQGNVVIYSDGSNDANLTLAGNATLAVRGDFIDHAPSTATNYGPSTTTIAFYGDPVTPGTISIARQLDNSFRIGDSGSDAGGLPGLAPSAGHVILGQNLITTGNFLVRSGSSLSLNHHTLTVGNLTLQAGADLLIAFHGPAVGVDYGPIIVTGAAAISGADLVVGSINNLSRGDMLTLITADSLTGTFADLADNGIVYVNGHRFATIHYTADAVTLTVLPEPSAALLLGLLACGGLMRRHAR